MNNNYEGRREKIRLFYRVYYICVKIFIMMIFEWIVMNVMIIFVRENIDCCCLCLNGYLWLKLIVIDYWWLEFDGRLWL